MRQSLCYDNLIGKFHQIKGNASKEIFPMNQNIPLKRLIVSTTMIAVVVLALWLSSDRQAVAKPAAQIGPTTHFRSAQLTWVKTASTTAEFNSTVGIRRSFFPGPPNIGDLITPILITYGDGVLDWPAHTVVFVDEVNDWLLAEVTFTHTYTGTGPYTAAAESCCRLSPPQHINNPDGNIRVETIVDLAATSANPISTIEPVVDCPKNALCKFTVPASDPDGQTLRYRLASSAEASGSLGTFFQPGPPHALHAATINPTTGLYVWDTTGATLAAWGDTIYSTQVIVENRVGGKVAAKTAVDFFIRIPGEKLTIYLPFIVKNWTPAPDLVVDSLMASSNTVTVTLKNIGDAPAVDPFWVDVYLNPNPAPSRVNQHWWELAGQGLVWGVTTPIAVGDTLTLTFGDPYYSAFHSRFTGSLAAGTPIWAQVDSVNLNTTYGGVLEPHEISGGAYNNFNSILLTVDFMTTNGSVAANGVQPPVSSSKLPPRR